MKRTTVAAFLLLALVTAAAAQEAEPLPPGALGRLGTTRFRHQDEVLALAFAPDGRSLASVGRDRTIAWSTSSGAPLARIERAGARDEQVAFVASTGQLVVASERAVRVAGRTVPLPGAKALALATDGTRVAVALEGGAVQVLELPSGEVARALEPASKKVRALAFARDGRALAVAGDDGRVRVFDLGLGKPVLSVTADDAHALAFLDEARLAIVGFERIRIVDAASGEDVHVLACERTSAFAFSPDGSLVAVASHAPAVRVLDVKTGDVRLELAGHRFNVNAVAFSPDGRLVASGDREGTICVHETTRGDERTPRARHRGRVLAVAFARDAIVTGANDLAVRVWDAKGALRRTLDLEAGLASLAVAPDGTIAIGGVDGSVRVASLAGEVARTLSGSRSSVDALAFSPDGKLLAGGSRDGRLRVWTGAAGEPRVLGTLPSGVTGVAFAPDGRVLASASMDRTVQLWPMGGGPPRKLATLERFPESLAFAPDGATLAVTSMDRLLRILDGESGTEKRRFGGGGLTVQTVAFAPDGRFATGGSDRVVRVHGARETRREGHEGTVLGLAFSPDGKVLASASADGTVLLWPGE